VNTETLTLANKRLMERVNALSAKLATQEKKLEMCFEFISNVCHFVPRMAEEFQKEFHKLEEDENVDVI
jgi:hypothetical protein